MVELRIKDNISERQEKIKKTIDHIREKTGQGPKLITSDHIDLNHMPELVRVPTGIVGLDELLEGGFPARTLVLLTGSCGTGKSIMGMKFLIDGCMRGEPCVYVSLQESVAESINQMQLFGWPVNELIKNGKLLIIQPELYNFDALMTTIEDTVTRIGAKRLVIDSISLIGLYFHDKFKVRKSLLDMGNMFKRLGCTTIAISETSEDTHELSPFGVEEFVADGVIVIYYLRSKSGEMFIRALNIRKMRSTKHSNKIHPIEIKAPEGVIVYPSEEVFAEII